MHEAILQCVRSNAILLREEWIRGNLDPSIKEDGTIISQFDARIEDELRRIIARVDPEASILGEELGGTRSPAQHEGRSLYVIDPIDGTHAFTNGSFSFAIVVERLDADREHADMVIALPAFDDIIRVDQERATHTHGTFLQLVGRRGRTFTANDQILCDAKLHQVIDPRFPGKLRSFGSTAHHAVEVARGRYLAMLFRSLAPWDALPVLALMDTVGASVAVLGGRRVTVVDFLGGKFEEAPQPLVFAAGHASIINQLAPHFPLRA